MQPLGATNVAKNKPGRRKTSPAEFQNKKLPTATTSPVKKITHDDEPQFATLQATLARVNRQGEWDEAHPWFHRLVIHRDGDLIDVQYQGEWYVTLEDHSTFGFLRELLLLLASPDFAPQLRSFTFRTEAVYAANGTYDFNIDPLIDGPHQFPHLESVILDQGYGEHGYKILVRGDSDFEEAGALACLLDRAPALRELVSPSPPSPAFFGGQQHPLQLLDVNSGFGHENFIRNLAASVRFPRLRRLVFTECQQTYMENWRTLATSFEDFAGFFQSPVAAQLEAIELNDVLLSSDEVKRLLAHRSEGVSIHAYQE